MARVVVPIIKLDYPADAAFDLELAEIAGSLAVTLDDDFTYTMRVTVEDEAQREAMRQALRERMPDQSEAVITLLDQHGWDVSFFVDSW